MRLGWGYWSVFFALEIIASIASLYWGWASPYAVAGALAGGMIAFIVTEAYQAWKVRRTLRGLGLS
jgi:hypothetical protein